MRIKILHISKMKGVSGSENHLLTLLAGLDHQRFDISLCILAESRHLPLLQEYTKTLEHAGISVVMFVTQKYPDVRLFLKLKCYIAQGRFQIVHTHLIHADFYGTLAAKLDGIPVIVSSRHNDDRFRHYKALIWLNRFLARWQTKIIVISDWVGKFLQEIEGIPTDKIVRIHYGLQPETLAEQYEPQYVRQQLLIPAGVPVIGTIGRVTEQKGHTYLLQAIAKVKTQFPELRVVILGDGELRTELERQATNLGVETNVIFTGYRKDAIKLLSGFDFFVFPSLWEGFGLVLLEAMALRKAIVASAVSAIPESVLDGQTGILTPPKNVDKLADAILTLLRDHHLAQTMGDAGYEHLQKHFTVSNMVRGTDRLYTSCLS
jgi:glycosyltransferase involved in cell wall biosynthesis